MKYNILFITLLFTCFSLSGKSIQDEYIKSEDMVKYFTNQYDSLKNISEVNIKTTKDIVESLLNLAYYSGLNSSVKKLEYSLMARDIAHKNNLIKQEYKALEYIASTFSNNNLNSKAIEYFDDLIQLCRISNNDSLQIYSYLLYGNFFTGFKDSENIKQGKFYLQSALNLAEKISYKDEVVNSLTSLAIMYRYNKEYEKALAYYKDSYKLSLSIGDMYGASVSLINFGDIYELLGHYDLSEKYSRLALNSYLENSFGNHGIYLAYFNLSSVNKHREKYHKALSLLDSAIMFTDKHKSFHELNEVFQLKANIYTEMNDYKNAYKNILLRDQYADSMNYNLNLGKISKIETSYKLNQHLQKNIHLQEKIKDERTKRYYWAGLLILIFVSIYTSLLSKLKKRRISELQLKEGKTKAELKSLQEKINPHFLFNSLNSLSVLVHKNSKEAESMLQDLSSLLRYTLNSARKKIVSVNDELLVVSKYLQIEKIRFGDRLKYEIECENSVKVFHIPPLIIQPLVENSIKHCISQCIDGGKIKIKSYLQNDKVVISVEDSGCSHTSSTLMPADKNGFEIDKEFGYKVTLRIPI